MQKENSVMDSFSANMTDYIESGHALIYLGTFEKDRAIREIVKISQDIGRKVAVWNIAQGWVDVNGESMSDMPPNSPVEDQLQAIVEFEENTLCVLQDFGCYLRPQTYQNYDVVIGWLDILRRIVANLGKNIVFVGPEFDIPKQLMHDVTTIGFDLPGNEQIKEIIEFACSELTSPDGTIASYNKEMIPQVVEACRGMTSQQTSDRVALAVRKHKDLNLEAIKTIIGEKASIIKASGLLTYVEPPEGGLSMVGGYDAIKHHVHVDRPCFSQEARDFGIEFPKGLMLVGIPGCGKTLLSLAIASELNLPLVSLDIGNLMNKFVGESEANMREALRILEKTAPCVLQIDEIEKGFGRDGETSGASTRVFGMFLKWLNDRQCPVYAIATANDVRSLPPEFCRKGRFDEIYGLGLPMDSEREDILRIHLTKRKRDPDNFDLPKLSEMTDGYTGADIEQVIKLGLKVAFSKQSDLEQRHLVEAVPEIIPLSKTETMRIAEIGQWCAKHAKQANPPPKTSPPAIGGRKIQLS